LPLPMPSGSKPRFPSMRFLLVALVLACAACATLASSVSSENELAAENQADQELDSEYYFVARAPSRAQRIVYAAPVYPTGAANRLVGTPIYSESTRSQVSSLRAAGVTVRVLAVTSSPGPLGKTDRVNLFTDTNGIIVRITFG
jgi:hypothetical protein